MLTYNRKRTLFLGTCRFLPLSHRISPSSVQRHRRLAPPFHRAIAAIGVPLPQSRRVSRSRFYEPPPFSYGLWQPMAPKGCVPRAAPRRPGGFDLLSHRIRGASGEAALLGQSSLRVDLGGVQTTVLYTGPRPGPRARGARHEEGREYDRVIQSRSCNCRKPFRAPGRPRDSNAVKLHYCRAHTHVHTHTHTVGPE